MQECTITTPHEPHCPSCNGPADIWIYEGVRPGIITTAGRCQSQCEDVVPCDGGLLASTFNEWETLDQGDTINISRRLLEVSRQRAGQCLVQPGLQPATYRRAHSARQLDEGDGPETRLHI